MRFVHYCLLQRFSECLIEPKRFYHLIPDVPRLMRFFSMAFQRASLKKALTVLIIAHLSDFDSKGSKSVHGLFMNMVSRKLSEWFSVSIPVSIMLKLVN